LNNVGETLGEMGKHVEALKYKKEALELSKKLLGDSHSYVAVSLNNVGGTLGKMGKHVEALEHFTQSYKILYKSVREKHPNHEIVLQSLLHCLQYQTNPVLISKAKEEILPLAAERLGEGHPLVADLKSR